MSLIRFLQYASLSWLLMVAGCVLAEPSLAIIKQIDEPIELWPYVETIEDPKGEYQFEDIQHGRYDQLWQQHGQRPFVGKNIKSRYWFRVALRWQGQQTLNAVVIINGLPSSVGQMVFTATASNFQTPIVNIGHNHPFTHRVLPTFFYAFPQTIPPDTDYTLWGWIENANNGIPAQLSLQLLSMPQFSDYTQMYNGVLIGFYTLIFALLLYNGFLFATLRQGVYGIYLAFLLGALFTCATLDGTIERFLCADTPVIRMRLARLNGFTCVIFYLLFVVTSLDGVKRYTWINRLVNGLLVIGLLGFLYNLFIAGLGGVSALLPQIYSGVVLPTTLVLIIWATINRLPTAGYLLAAEVVTVGGGVIFLLRIQGVLPSVQWTIWGLHWGFAGEAVLLSLSLAARTRLAQQAAINNLQKYEALFNESVEGLFQYNFKTREIKCNTAMAKLFGYNHSDEIAIKDTVFDGFSPDFQRDIWQKLKEKGYIQNYETEITPLRLATSIWVSITLRLVKDKNGQPIGSEGSLVDISERKLKEQAEREKQISEIQSKAKSQFFASMSHEFRTPLSSILGYAEIASRAETSDQERREQVNIISSNAQHLLQLINDILDLSKIEAQQLDTVAVDVNPFEISQAVEDFVSILAHQKGVSLLVDYRYPLPESIVSDPMRLKQALINLCSNSIKFTAKGSVTLRIECDRAAQLIFFSVIDTGIGLKPEQIQKLFKAYSQAESSTSQTFGGTGLGLYLSKLIANKLGGDITIESVYGEGSTFTLSVSTGQLETVQWIETPSAAQAAIKPESCVETVAEEINVNKDQVCRVLLADDNSVNLQLMTFYLKQLGVSVVAATDGLEVIAEALKAPFDLVLIDMDMPIMDGLTTVRYLRDKSFDKPIYALTGNVAPDAIDACIRAGCNGHLSKPIDTVKLQALIASISG